MSLAELKAYTENISTLKAILYCFYPISVLVALELLAHALDDDDNQNGGKMINLARCLVE